MPLRIPLANRKYVLHPCNIEQSAEVQKTELLGCMFTFNILRGHAWNILKSCCSYHYYACTQGCPAKKKITAKAPESHDEWNFGGSPKTGIATVPAMCPVFKYTQAATDSLALTATTNDLPSLRKLGRMLEAKTKGVGGQFQEGNSWWSMVELKHVLWGLICSLLDPWTFCCFLCVSCGGGGDLWLFTKFIGAKK